jgi:DNA (cytosine-5)-methyltransferase 1
MVAAIAPGSGASAWENDRCGQCGLVDVGEDDATCPLCGQPLLRPVVEEDDGTYRLVKGFRSSSYRRMSPDKPAATLTTGSGHIGCSFTIHPYENRLFSPLECARLQSFPTDFKWGDALKKWGHTNVRAMIGEAVPPLFTRLHGAALLGLLTGQWSVAPISQSDQRCVNARKTLSLPDPRFTGQPREQ